MNQFRLNSNLFSKNIPETRANVHNNLCSFFYSLFPMLSLPFSGNLFCPSSPSVDMLSLIYSIVCDPSLLSTLTLNTFTCSSPPLTSLAITLHHLSSPLSVFVQKKTKSLKLPRDQNKQLCLSAFEDSMTCPQTPKHILTVITASLYCHCLKCNPKKALCFSFSVAPNLSISLPTCKHFRGLKPIWPSSPGLCLSLPCCGDSTHRGLRETVGAFQARQTDKDRSE